ncbi:hypothetical protein [Nostoc sp. WHI]|uniref:hypothetical protein n=1 Tax=Nostoc sp. WHI TaxID=2650611 RepID=UPI0018C7D64E|nr:hypothetical protein [Nostoc sp. WHI]MBG1271021.1 hypothetical protein [Nostoc sp. WHI]
MAKSFGEENKSRILQKLTDDRDIILGFSWKSYLKDGLGAVILRAVEDGEEIKYRAKNKIDDFKDLKIVEENNPNLAAVVFAYYGKGEYLVTTLIGPKTPPECYENLPEDLKS